MEQPWMCPVHEKEEKEMAEAIEAVNEDYQEIIRTQEFLGGRPLTGNKFFSFTECDCFVIVRSRTRNLI